MTNYALRLPDPPQTRGGAVSKRHYRLIPPLLHEDHYPREAEVSSVDYVVVSASNRASVPETYIFEADVRGEIVSWSELPGSFRGGLDHDAALRRAGYTPISSNELAAAIREYPEIEA